MIAAPLAVASDPLCFIHRSTPIDRQRAVDRDAAPPRVTSIDSPL
jgi:hypothetical protein